MVPQGRCPKCGAVFYGWALRSPRNQMCERCGTGLEISDEGSNPVSGYSPFTAEEYKIKSPDKTSHIEGAKEKQS